MGDSVRKIILLLLLYSFCAGCGDNECRHQSKNLTLDTTYSGWFANAENGVYKETRSAKGLSESLYLSRYKGTSSLSPPADPCISYNSEENALYYNSYLYNFQFSFRVVQERDAPYFVCQVTDYNGAYGYAQMKRNLTTGKQYPITVQTRSYLDSVTSYMSDINIIDSLILPQRTYYNIYKITNGFFKDHAGNFSIIEFYLDKNEGLVQFKQKNGDTWNF